MRANKATGRTGRVDMPQVHLHIGGYKTGSTSIQAFLANRRGQMVRDAGLLYPKSLTHDDGGPGHVPLVQALIAAARRGDNGQGGRLEKLMMALAVEVAQAEPQHIVVSSEVFLPALDLSRGLADPAILARQELFADAQVIYYARPQWEAALSKYKQVIKNPKIRYTGDFRSFVERWLPTVRYAEVLEPWRQAFSAERMVLRPYPGPAGRDFDAVADFLATIGVEVAFASGAERENANISRGLYVTEQLRRYHEANPDISMHRRDVHPLLKQFEASASDAEKDAFEAEYKERIRPILAEIRERVADDNAKLIRAYALPADFFGPVAATVDG
ncbi:MAG: hypothetical protein AAGE18_02115 [Pseudomonadota bacterium]